MPKFNMSRFGDGQCRTRVHTFWFRNGFKVNQDIKLFWHLSKTNKIFFKCFIDCVWTFWLQTRFWWWKKSEPQQNETTKQTSNVLLLKFPTEKSDICYKLNFSHTLSDGFPKNATFGIFFLSFSPLAGKSRGKTLPKSNLGPATSQQSPLPPARSGNVSIKKWKISIIKIFGLSPKIPFFPTFAYKYQSRPRFTLAVLSNNKTKSCWLAHV